MFLNKKKSGGCLYLPDFLGNDIKVVYHHLLIVPSMTIDFIKPSL